MTSLFVNLHLDRILRPWFQGLGVALMFHRVLPDRDRSVWTGLRGLEVTDAFFEGVLKSFKEDGYTFLTLSEFESGLFEKSLPRKFVLVTFDDGYVDNFEIVAPIMKRLRLPWALFLTTDFPEGSLRAWWYALGAVLTRNRVLDLRTLGGETYNLSQLSIGEKDQLYTIGRNLIHSQWTDRVSREKVEKFFADHHLNLLEYSQPFSMTWEKVRFVAESNCEIGAHTLSHARLPGLSSEDALKEIEGSKKLIELNLNRVVTSFAYPFGDRASFGPREVEVVKQSGLKIAFTTLNGWIFQGHELFPYTLPRINVSGHFLSYRQFEARLNGMATLMESGIRRMVTE